MRDSLLTGCTALVDAAALDDDDAFTSALSATYERVAAARRTERDAAMRFLGEHIERCDPRRASWVAVLAAGLASLGTDPMPVVAPILACLKTVAEAAAYFAGAWRDATDEPCPEPQDAVDPRVHRLLEPALGDATSVVLEAWACLPRWTAAALATLAASATARRADRDTPLLVRVVTAGAEHYPALHQVRALLAEPRGPEPVGC
ncbi:MAG: hypothetical protein WCA46_22015 [Actinocatenispora sp.]